MEVFSKDKTETLPLHQSTNHAIDLESGYNMPYGQIYNLLEFELRTLKAYIEANLANGFVQQLSSPAAAPILFAKKKVEGEGFLLITMGSIWRQRRISIRFG